MTPGADEIGNKDIVVPPACALSAIQGLNEPRPTDPSALNQSAPVFSMNGTKSGHIQPQSPIESSSGSSAAPIERFR
jgi:hypothetical protein